MGKWRDRFKARGEILKEIHGKWQDAEQKLYYAQRWAALWKRAAKKWRAYGLFLQHWHVELSNAWSDAESMRDVAVKQRNEAARLYWRMKADRDGYRELYNETRTANAEVWGKVVKANQRIAKLEAQLAKTEAMHDKIVDEWWHLPGVVIRQQQRIDELEHKLTVAHVNRGDYELSLLRIAELEAELVARDKRTCETCAHWIDDDHQCDLGHNVDYIRYTNGIGGVRKHTPVDKFSCSEWQERET